MYKRTKTDKEAKSLYKELEKVYKETITKHLINSEINTLSHVNKKYFYDHIKSKLKTRSYLPPLINNQNEIITNPKDKANLINSHFANVFIKDNNITPQISYLTTLQNISPMNNFEITSSHVNKAKAKLKNSVSNMPDNIPSIYIKQTSSSLPEPLTRPVVGNSNG